MRDIDQSNVSIRPGDEHDVPTVVALLDGAVEWLVAAGRAAQWGTDPYSAEPRCVAAMSSMAAAATGTFEIARPTCPWPGQVLQQRLS
jgi:hypothetical protein